MRRVEAPAGHIRVFDTTLRDGEQAPGCTMTLAQKAALAAQLARLGVDVIEAGFPASSTGEALAVTAIAREVGAATGTPVICALARATERDIDACAAALAPAHHRRVHAFIATSDLHLQHKLNMSRPAVVERVARAVRHARAVTDDVEFSPEDASRSDPQFLDDVLVAAVEAGATTLNIPDTVGYSTPTDYGALIAHVVALVAHHPDIVVSTHCHDDLGLAVANTLAGVHAGARQVECTINGVGERAGNAALEEVIMALRTRVDIFGQATRVQTTEIARTSQLVSAYTGIAPPPNKAIVGANAFAHEAGIHQDGVLKHRRTYEVLDAESVGRDGGVLVLGKHSGRHALRRRLAKLGRSLDDTRFATVFAQFKELADMKIIPTDTDLAQLVDDANAAQPRTMLEKIWDEHVVRAANESAPAVLYVDLHLIHEVTSAQAFAELKRLGIRVRRPERTFATMDHATPTAPRTGEHARTLTTISNAAQTQIDALRQNCRDAGIELFALDDERQGIVHVIGPELGLTHPGATIVCGDSHTSTHGAFGALAFGIGTSQVAHVLATQCVLQPPGRSMVVDVEGKLPTGVTAKDLILALIAQIGTAGATGHILEYRGDTIRRLSMDERMTVCNMSIEAGARAGMIAPDDTTFEYLHELPHAPRERAWDAAVARWRTLRSDDGARFDAAVRLDAGRLEPMITYGTNPGMAVPVTGRIPNPSSIADPTERATLEQALRYMNLVPDTPLIGTRIDVVFFGSCTNGRLSDLRTAARLLRGRRVAPGVRALVVPGSQRVKRDAEREGLADIFRAAGAEWREPGCSMCIAMNGDVLAPGQRAVSTSNRNFEGRQGPGSRTLLASPLTAAAAAITGVVTDARALPMEHA